MGRQAASWVILCWARAVWAVVWGTPRDIIEGPVPDTVLGVLDRNEEEAACWSGLAGARARSRACENLLDVVGWDTARGCVDEGSHQVADHVMQKS